MQISDAEWQVMKIIWMQGEQTSSDLIRVLAERFDWSKSTIQTLFPRQALFLNQTSQKSLNG